MPFQDTVISGTQIHDHSDNALGGKLVAGDTSYDLSNGSILYSNGSVQLELGIGTGTDVLGIVAGVPAWVSPTASVVAAGSLVMWCGLYDSIPSGWLLCDGSEISRATYADLFAAVGIQFGSTGGGTFTLPLFQSIFPRSPAASTSCGATGGSDTVSLTADELASHSHTANVTDGGHVHGLKLFSSGGSNGIPTTRYGNHIATVADEYGTTSQTTGITVSNTNTGSGDAHENKPSYLEVLFIIKT